MSSTNRDLSISVLFQVYIQTIQYSVNPGPLELSL